MVVTADNNVMVIMSGIDCNNGTVIESILPWSVILQDTRYSSFRLLPSLAMISTHLQRDTEKEQMFRGPPEGVVFCFVYWVSYLLEGAFDVTQKLQNA